MINCHAPQIKTLTCMAYGWTCNMQDKEGACFCLKSNPGRQNQILAAKCFGSRLTFVTLAKIVEIRHFLDLKPYKPLIFSCT